MSNQGGETPFWSIAGRIATVGGILALIGVPSLFALFGWFHNSSDTPAAGRTPTAGAAVESGPQTPTPFMSSTAPHVSPPGSLAINLRVESAYWAGKGKVFSCEEVSVFCVAVENAVYTPDGTEQTGGCHLAWQLYSGPELFEQGVIQYCGVDTIFLGRKPMLPGPYQLRVQVDLDDGRSASTKYDFTATPRSPE
ncbi:hypothetical protein AB0E77_33130 [Streptomyces sp. NPDC032940]|uniref:hypothetical protein n=1 Tax=Streptomyces sp. NPDC032940 TaxID=3155366 RepID=UPI0033ED65DE